jgi:hypothetical protein
MGTIRCQVLIDGTSVITLSHVGVLRRLAQGLGLVYRDDGTWRPTGMRTPPSASKSQSTNPPAEPSDP